MAAKRAAGREIVCPGKARNVAAGHVAPTAAADQHHRPFCGCEQPAQLGEVARSRVGADRAVGAGHRGDAAIAQHVLGQRQDHRTRPAGGRDLEGLVDQLGDALGQIDLCNPFRERREHFAEIDLLKGLAVELVAGDLADENDHRRRILEGGVDADRGVACARTASHE